MRRLLSLALLALAACNSSTDENTTALPQVLDLQTSSFKGCVLVEGGDLWCWGVVPSVSSFTSPALTPVRVPVPGSVTSFALSVYSLCATTSAGATYCAGSWVDVDIGQPYGAGGGLVLLQDSLALHGLNASSNHVCGVTNTQRLVCWGSRIWAARGEGAPDTSESNTVLNQVAGNDPYLAVSAEDGVSCGLRTDQTLTCWGLLDYLGTTPPASQVSQTCYFNLVKCVWTPVLLPFSNVEQVSGMCLRAGVVKCWGYDGLGNAVPTPTTLPMPEHAIDLNGACAIGLSGTAYCWGSPGSHLGHHFEDGLPHAVETGLRFQRVAGRGSANCGLTEAQAVYCWGEGFGGAIGDGDTTHSYTPRRVTPSWAAGR